MKGYISEEAARILAQANYRDEVPMYFEEPNKREFDQALDQWLVDQHFEHPRAGDEVDISVDRVRLLYRGEGGGDREGWYLVEAGDPAADEGAVPA